MRKLTFAALGLAALLLSGGRVDAAIAYDNATGVSPLQNWSGSLGMDFTVNAPISVTSLGVFDNGILGNLAGVGGNGVQVGIYNVTTGTLVSPLVTFTPTTSGITQTNGDAFLTISPITLAAGTYSIVSVNAENYNSFGATNTTVTTNTGGGLISFVGTGRFSASTSGLPGTIDTGPAARYDAGTFIFASAAVPEPSSIVALTSGLTLALGFMWRKKKAA